VTTSSQLVELAETTLNDIEIAHRNEQAPIESNLVAFLLSPRSLVKEKKEEKKKKETT
jgi:hypothetical protein